MKKIFILSILILFAHININAQNLKKYAGNYSLSWTYIPSGKAEYTYYTQDNTEIRQGHFSLSATNTTLPKTKISVNGNYKNNLKNGEWNYTVDMYPDGGTLQMKLSANYVDGYPHGLWNATMLVQKGKLKASYNLKTSFNKGTVVGNFNLITTSQEKNITYQAKFDNQGYYISETDRENQEVTSKKFHKGVLITDNYSQAKIEEIVSKIDYYKSNYPDSLAEYPYTLSESDSELPHNTYTFLFFNLFLFNDVKGDVLFEGMNEDEKVIYKYYGFKTREIHTQETKGSKYNAQIAFADSVLKNEEYKNAIEYYEKALEYKPNAEYAKTKIIDTKYQKQIKEADNFFANKQFEFAQQSYQEALSIKTTPYVEQQLNLVKTKIVDTKYQQLIVNGDIFLANNLFDDARKSYQAALFIRPDPYPKQQFEKIKAKEIEYKQQQAQREIEDKFKTFVAKGDEWFKKGKYGKAKTEYKEALKINPNDIYTKEQKKKSGRRLVGKTILTIVLFPFYVLSAIL